MVRKSLGNIVNKFVITLVFACGVVSGCAVNPVTGERELALVSDRQAIAIGTQQYLPSQQMQGGEYVVDPDLQAYVSRVGQRLAVASGVDLPYEFVVLNNSTPNAWALPGGKIAINRGLLVHLRNEAEMAAVLGHEIAHAAARHGAKRIERNMVTQGLLVATAITVSGSGVGNEVVGLASQGAALLGLKYSRDAEREADYYGTEFMAKAGYDPYAAVTLQEKFLELSGNKEANGFAQWMASHPPSSERVSNNRTHSRQLREAGYEQGKFNQAEYERATRGLRANAAAYEAHDEAAKLFREENYDGALAQINKAISAFPQEAQFHGLRGAVRAKQSRMGDAITNFNRAIERNANYFLFYLNRGFAYAEEGKMAEARKDLEGSVALLPTSAAYNGLGQIAEKQGDTESAKRFYEQAAKSGGAEGERARARYVALDLDAQPARYLPAQLAPAQGGVILQVRNESGLAVTDVVVQIELASASGTKVESVRVGSIGAGQQVQRRFDVAGVTGGRAYTVAAKLAQ